MRLPLRGLEFGGLSSRLLDRLFAAAERFGAAVGGARTTPGIRRDVNAFP